MSPADVLRASAASTTSVGVQSGLDAVTTREEEEEETLRRSTFLSGPVSPAIRKTYDKILRRLYPPYPPGTSLATLVAENYDYCDAQLLKILSEDSGDNGDNGDNGDSVEGASELLAAIGDEQNKRMVRATETLRSILSLGSVPMMLGKVMTLAREGFVDEPFLLLLEANALQAENAGATGPAKVLRQLKARGEEEKDKLNGKVEIRLLRKLLRAPTPSSREDLLTSAFTPKEQLLVEGSFENMENAETGKAPEEAKPLPDVPPPDFISCCKAVLLNFGNLNSGEEANENASLAERIKLIASEAEIVATKIYGQSTSTRELNDRAWDKASTSIFDLETMELDEMTRGGMAPWAKDGDEEGGGFDMPGFGADGKMRIGGS